MFPRLRSLTALALLLLTTTLSPAQNKPTPRPNVILILADDMGYSDIGAFGSEISTPHIDSLATAGTRFTQFYNTARCCPSRASLLTGLYPHQAGVGHMLWPTGYPGYTTRLSRDSVTIAEVLHDAGYRTYMTGKWHLAERVADPKNPVGWPLDRGFDRFYGTLAGYGSFFDPASLCRDNTYITPDNDPQYKPNHYYYTDAISDNAVKYLQDHAAASPDKPFFMYVAYTAAHWPLQAPEDAIAPYKGKYDAGYDPIRQQRIANLKKLGLMPPVTTPAPTTGDWDAVKNKPWEARRMEVFAAMISRMDQGIGKIVDQLRATSQLDNTLILYMHDNGGCDEEFIHNNQRPPQNLHVMKPDELQDRTLPPMQTRDGKPVKPGESAMAGPADSFVGYGPDWANVSDTPLRLVKKFAHEGGISTPLIVHWPAGASATAGKVVPTPSHLIDVMPTVLQVTAAPYPAQRAGHTIQPPEGKSLLPLLNATGDFDRDQPLFWEHEGNRAIRDGDWKLVAEENKPWELYNLSTDRSEIHDLAAQHPDRVKQLAAAWQTYAERAKVQPFGAHRLRDRTPDPANTPTSLPNLRPGALLQGKNAPSLSNAGILITAHIEKLAPEGVLVAQGAQQHGYSLYMHQGRAHFSIRRAGQLLTLSTPPLPMDSPNPTLTARLDRDGAATLQFNNDPPATSNFAGPFLQTPADGLSVSSDQDKPVADYKSPNPFQGTLTSITLQLLTN